MNSINKGYTCEHCGSFVKLYKRSFNANMAVALLTLYRYAPNMFVKAEDLLIKCGRQRCGDFSYLRHYRFIEPQKATREDGSKRNGYYRITALGIMFCEGKVTAPSNFLIIHNNLKGFGGREINIHEALGKKFNYNELMGYPTEVKKQTQTLFTEIQ